MPRGSDTAPGEMQFILRHSGSKLVFVETDQLARDLLAHRGSLPDLEQVCTLRDETEVDGVLTIPQLLERGRQWNKKNPGALAARTERVRPDDLLTIVYTSGTTAEPKGVMLTHKNVLSNVRTANMVFDFYAEDRFLSTLPSWHMYERIMDYIALAFGAEIVYTDRRNLKKDLIEMQPTLFAAVPRIWEAIFDGFVSHCKKLPPRKRKLMEVTLRICQRIAGGRAGLRDKLAHRVLRATVLKKFAKITGGRMRVAVSGGGALPTHVDEALLGLGLPLCNGYGLTETSPVVSARPPNDNRSGTIGPALPETEVEILDDAGATLPTGEIGLIWIKGPGVMQGYYKNPQGTARVLRDGWFNSGDLGCVDRDGVIRITGRAKDTIVLASGENAEPEPLETAIKMSSLIDQAVVVGQDQKGLGALLVVAAECLEHEVPREEWKIDGPLVTSKRVHDLLRAELDTHIARDAGFRPTDHIARFRVLHEPLTPDNGLMTQTLKVKRHVIQEKFGEVIAAMFTR